MTGARIAKKMHAQVAFSSETLRSNTKEPPKRVEVAKRNSLTFEGQRETTALLGIGHVGTRYATDVVLQFQAELAVAHQAVATELPEGWAEAQGFLPVASRVTTHREFLLRPDLGRRLDDASKLRLAHEAKHDVDVQIIVADGLSAHACLESGPELAHALRTQCVARGLSVGTLVCAKFARVWLEDEIGAATRAKVAIILLGERPGLGTGDGLSAYVVYDPKIGNTDGHRNMISNIHARGVSCAQAAERLTELSRAMLVQKTSGVALDLSKVAAGAVEVGYRLPQVRQRLISPPNQ